ncbi:hypothetical protein Tco_0801712 [Tanacetum coccineum]|uniref:Uncharacterized protein n=1 Tax=Tanacetum coccineum TaxID=301880 RepID=A0ABQ4ZWQ9_9ASTR
MRILSVEANSPAQVIGRHDVLFSEEIALLKRSVGHKEYQMGLLRAELEKVKQEKEGFEFKIAKFDKSAKDLEQLLGSLEEFKEPEVSDDEDDDEPNPKVEKKTVKSLHP